MENEVRELCSVGCPQLNRANRVTTSDCNAGDELLRESNRQETTLYGYDPNGNTTSKTVYRTADMTKPKPNPQSNVTYSWDYENRMVGFGVKGPSRDSVYTYYGDTWRRTVKQVHNNIEKYLYDEDEILVDYNAPGNLKALYVNGPIIDERLAMLCDGQLYYYLTDHLGSVRQLIDAYATEENYYDYEGFGGSIFQTEAVSNRFAFCAREFDRENVSYYNRSRHYLPGVGLFLGPDPWAELAGSHFGYSGMNPLNSRDPSGLMMVRLSNNDWEVWRTQDERARAFAKQNGDPTIQSLAGLIGMDIGSCSFWLSPNYVCIGNRPIRPCQEFTVPNVFRITVGDVRISGYASEWDKGHLPFTLSILNALVHDMAVGDAELTHASASLEGFKVVVDLFSTVQDIRTALKDKNIWGFYFKGHGYADAYGGSLNGFVGFDISADEAGITMNEVRGIMARRYRLGKVILNSCYSHGWKDILTSSNGSFLGWWGETVLDVDHIW